MGWWYGKRIDGNTILVKPTNSSSFLSMVWYEVEIPTQNPLIVSNNVCYFSKAFQKWNFLYRHQRSIDIGKHTYPQRANSFEMC